MKTAFGAVGAAVAASACCITPVFRIWYERSRGGAFRPRDAHDQRRSVVSPIVGLAAPPTDEVQVRRRPAAGATDAVL